MSNGESGSFDAEFVPTFDDSYEQDLADVADVVNALESQATASIRMDLGNAQQTLSELDAEVGQQLQTVGQETLDVYHDLTDTLENNIAGDLAGAFELASEFGIELPDSGLPLEPSDLPLDNSICQITPGQPTRCWPSGSNTATDPDWQEILQPPKTICDTEPTNPVCETIACDRPPGCVPFCVSHPEDPACQPYDEGVPDEEEPYEPPPVDTRDYCERYPERCQPVPNPNQPVPVPDGPGSGGNGTGTGTGGGGSAGGGSGQLPGGGTGQVGTGTNPNNPPDCPPPAANAPCCDPNAPISTGPDDATTGRVKCSTCQTCVPGPCPVCPECGGPTEPVPVQPETCEAQCPTKMFAWRDSRTGECYITNETSPPRDPRDELLEEGMAGERFYAAVRRQCGTRSESPPPQIPAGGGLRNVQAGLSNICRDWGILGSVNATNDPHYLGKSLGYRDKNGQLVDWREYFKEVPVIGGALGALANALTHSFDTLEQSFLSYVNNSRCGSSEAISAAISRAFMGALSYVTGDALEPQQNQMRIIANAECPSLLPSPAEATHAWLAGEIDEETLACYVVAAGLYWQPFQPIVRSQKTKFSPFDLTALYRRGSINGQEFTRRIREHGFIDGGETDALLDLTKALPPITDLLRFMVRDVADPNVVNRFGLDSDFANKWQGELANWGNQQGIPLNYAQYAWRAHWTIPSPTALFEMYHRLRRLPAGDPRAVTEADIREALKQQDVLPFWIDKYLAISHPPLTRIDVRRAYEIGAIDKPQVQAAYVQLGYDDANAQILADFTELQRNAKLKNNHWVKAYRANSLSRAKATQELQADGFDLSSVNDALDTASLLADVQVTATCLKGYERRFMLGEITDVDALALLNNLGLDPEQIQRVTKSWQCKQHARGKHAPAATLCKWLANGVIDAAEMELRLIRVGWDRVDAQNFVTQCLLDMTAKRSAAERKALEKARREKEKSERDKKRADKEAEAAAARAAKALEARKKLAEKREAALISLADQYRERTSVSLLDAYNAIKGALAATRNYATLDLDDGIEVLTRAVESDEWRTGAQLQQIANRLAELERVFDPVV